VAEHALGLPDDEKGVFKKNGFVMVDHGNNLSMGQAYLRGSHGRSLWPNPWTRKKRSC
jgi:hypothetical protein